MASSDMPEVLALSHRALVLKDGGVVAELDRAALQHPDVQDRIFRLASGLDISDALPAPPLPQRTTNDRHPYRLADLRARVGREALQSDLVRRPRDPLRDGDRDGAHHRVLPVRTRTLRHGRHLQTIWSPPPRSHSSLSGRRS